MTKSQFILLTISLFLVIGLYFLPKVVLNENEMTFDNSEVNFDSLQSHVNTGVDSIVKINESIFSKLKTAQNEIDSLTLLGDIISNYQKVNNYDSAAYIAEKFTLLDTRLSFKILAGEAYYDAFTFAIKQERIQLFASKTQSILKEVLDIDETLLDLKVKLGMTYVNSSNPMQGILMIREVIEKEPNNQLAIFNLGVLSMQSGQFDKAVSRFEKLRTLVDDDTQTAFYLGICYKELKNKEKAVELFQYVLKNTNDEEIRNTVKPYLDDLM